MISVPEAREVLIRNYPQRKTVTIPLSEAAGRVLAKEVHSLVDVPGFDNSAMDGYAFDFASWNQGLLGIAGESAAGKPFSGKILPGEAVRVFTGAAIPVGADTVVMQEKIEIREGKLWITDAEIKRGVNVRKAGSQNSAGDLLLPVHTYLSAGALGFLAGCGISQVEVFEKPVVCVLVTGDEIVPPGNEIRPGQLYESNSFSLIGALHSFGIVPEVKTVADDQERLNAAITYALSFCDILLITGGVSVGDYDYVVPALESQRVSRLFHRVKQKPAKPLYAGKLGEIMVFGLPGNPASVLTSFYVYVAPMLRHLLGFELPAESALLKSDFSRRPGLTQFLKGKYQNGEVEILGGQESYRMDGFALANCLIEVAADIETLKAGERVPVILFN